MATRSMASTASFWDLMEPTWFWRREAGPVRYTWCGSSRARLVRTKQASVFGQHPDPRDAHNGSMDSYRPALEAAARLALDYLERLDQRPVAGCDLALLDRLDRPLADDGIAPEQVIAELVHDAEPGIIGSAGGRFFGWVIGGAVPSAVAADWLTIAWDQNAAMAGSAPAAARVEEIAGGWLKQILGLPADASFAFVTGCQMAHVTCLAAARHGLLEKCGWDVEERGLNGAPPIRLISSDQRHGTFERAVRLLGFGAGNVEYLAVDADGRLPPRTLADALGKNQLPAIVLLQAGEINTGLYDSFADLIPVGTAA